LIQFLNQKLYHISENPSIAHFVPQPDKNGVPKVWAISAERVQNYLFPRDCPRICIWVDADTNDTDRSKLRTVNSIISVEENWFERIQSTTLYAYVFDSAEFVLEDANAGYFTASTTQEPQEVLRVDDPLRQLNLLGARLEVLSELHSFRETVLSSSFAFSMIRMRNAAPIPQMPI